MHFIYIYYLILIQFLNIKFYKQNKQINNFSQHIPNLESCGWQATNIADN